MWQALLTVVVLSACAQAEERASRVVDTAQGPVLGYRESEYGLFAFYGIPYATAPTGRHRFRGPLPPPVRMHTLEAVDQDIICPQAKFPIDFGLPTRKEQENCLITNIFIPDTEETNLPVVVLVHGGAFQMGNGNMMSQKNLVKSKKVISVTFNYRLGIHGFLCLGTEDAPGNAGMKDQVALLRWVKKNIASFGGNPNDITIDGLSAGSASVDLLMISKTTTGLFHKVIPESGANLGTWSIQMDPIENAKMFAQSQNFTNVEDIYALDEFYKTAPYKVLTSDPFWDRTDSTFLFSPCVERDIGVERFLDEAPLKILESGNYNKVPLLYGFANMEGLLRLDFFEPWHKRMNDKFSDFLPSDLQFVNEKQKEAVAKKIKEYYFGDKSLGPESKMQYINYFSDVLFVYGTLRAVNLHLKSGHNQIYLYEFTFVDDTSTPSHDFDGANHCAQSAAVLDGGSFLNPDEDTLSENYKQVKKYMRELWINFITTGKPVPEGSKLPTWPHAVSPVGPYMSLGKTMVLKDHLAQERYLFWENIYAEHGRVPVPPQTPITHSEL